MDERGKILRRSFLLRSFAVLGAGCVAKTASRRTRRVVFMIARADELDPVQIA